MAIASRYKRNTTFAVAKFLRQDLVQEMNSVVFEGVHRVALSLYNVYIAVWVQLTSIRR
jgi:hypothetical protein